jgi:CDP-glucose 4,6-dehydratase
MNHDVSTDPFNNAFRGKRVLVTGHTGFKGPWLLAMLDRLGATTLGYSLAPETKPSMFDLIGGWRLCEHVFGDLRDRKRLVQLTRSFSPDVVLHLGAQSLVRRSYREPTETFESNITGTMNVLEAIRRHDGRCAAVMVTTDKVYAESGRGEAYDEASRLGGHDPYSASKAACEIVAESYRKSFFAPEKFVQHGKAVATARAGNVIGGGDWCEDRLIPDVVRAMTRGESVRVRNPRSTRPWQHVLESLSGYLTLAAKLMREPTNTGPAFNFGPDERDVLDVETVVKLALKAWGSGGYYVDADPDAPHEAALLRISSDRAKRELGWQPRWDATTAINKTIDWYRHAKADPLAYTRAQIDEYFRSMSLPVLPEAA